MNNSRSSANPHQDARRAPRLFTSRQLVAALTGMALLGGFLHVAAVQQVRSSIKRVEQQLAESQRERQSDAAEVVEDYAAALSEMFDRIGYAGGALTPADRQQLTGAQMRLRKLLQQQLAGDSSREQCGNTALQLGRAAVLLKRFDEAESALREAIRLLDESEQASGRLESRSLGNEARLALSCLLAPQGRLDESKELLNEVLESSASTPDRSALADSLRYQQLWREALACRNLGLIHAMNLPQTTGIPSRVTPSPRAPSTREPAADSAPSGPAADVTRAVAYLRQSIGLTQQLVAALPQLQNDLTEVGIAEHLVDTYQILATLQHDAGNQPEANAAWHAALDELIRIRQTLADRPQIDIASHKYKTLESILRTNLEDAANARRAGSTPTAGAAEISRSTAAQTSAMEWAPMWLSLHRGFSFSLQPDLLAHGRLPAEFVPQDALLMVWADEEWCHATLTEVISAVQQHLQVVLLVPNEALRNDAYETLDDAGVSLERVRLVNVPLDTMWIRDYGPLQITLSRGGMAFVDAIYGNHTSTARYADDNVPWELARLWRLPTLHPALILDGGALLVNGDGLCLASQMILAWNSVAGLSEEHVTRTLKRLTGADQVVYLEALRGESTGHIDWFTCFTAPDTVVVADYVGENSYNAQLLDRHAAQLARLRTRSGPLRVERIRMPARSEEFFGGTYTNVVFANGVLLVPTWREAEADCARALNVYRRLLPDWKITPIDSQDIGLRGGGLRCMTVNVPHLGRLSLPDSRFAQPTAAPRASR